MDTPLNRVENLLQNGGALYIHQIVKQAGITEKAAKASIKTLSSMGQIEVIPTPGRWGNRYAWLAAKPLPKEATPAAPADSGQKNEAELAAHAPPTLSVAGEPGPELVETSNEYAKAFAMLFGRLENPRYLVLVPKRKPRIVKSRARAEALALAAVRRGAPAAEVCELESIGTARRDAVFVEVG